MGFDFFTIRNLAAELDAYLTGKTVVQVGVSQAELGVGTASDRHLYARFGREGWVCLRPGPLPAALEYGKGAEGYLVGAVVEKVWAEPRDRLLWIGLARTDSSGRPSYGRLGLELIHPHFQAYLVSEQTGLVVGVWGDGGRTRHHTGKPFVGPPGPKRLLPGVDGFATFAEAWSSGVPSAKALARLVVGLDPALAGLLLRASGIEPQGPTNSVALDRLWALLEDAYTSPPDLGGYLWQTEERIQFSGLKPFDQDCELLPSISQVILRAKAAEEMPWLARNSGEDFGKRLRLAYHVLRRRQRALEGDLAEALKAEEIERKANSLLANLGAMPPGKKSVEIPDIYDSSGRGRVRVEIDRNKTAAETAGQLLRTARRYRQRRVVVPRLLARVAGQLAEVEQMLASGEKASASSDTWLSEQGLGCVPGATRKRGETSAHPRRYCTSTGWIVWVGRNNRENDLLSHRLAAQNDIWFHAHGYPGAHVVLRREGRREEPSNQTLMEAASLAAYWSKGKTARKVPVVYTLVKYVSKPKGGAPGQALVKREKTMMVEPGLLQEEGGRGTKGE